MQRYLRAFVTALKVTLKGQTLPAPIPTHPRLRAWIAEALRLTALTFQIADSAGFDSVQRQAFKLTIERRQMSLETILSAVRHNISLEYPMLLKSGVEGNITAIYALNLDDQYRVQQALQAATLPETLRPALQDLARHLQAIPPSNDLG